MAFRYRSRETGRFVARSTWARSKAHGGTRFKREIIRRAPPKPLTKKERVALLERVEEEIELLEPEELEDIVEETGGVDYA